MQETDLSDEADYAASQQQGSASMITSETSVSRASEPEGSQVVYVKDNVTLHPSQFGSERISGRLKLIKLGSSLFMSWIPYKGQNSNASLSEKDRNLYTIRAVPFTEINSIGRHTPAFGWQYIIVVLSSGLAYPPLYFYSGGLRQFLSTIKQHVFIVRSANDSNVFVVNDFQNPLQKTLSSLELPRAISFSHDQSVSLPVDQSSLHLNGKKTDGGIEAESSNISKYRGRLRQKVKDRDLSIQVLEKFSRVTRFARETTSQLFRESHSNGDLRTRDSSSTDIRTQDFSPTDMRTHDFSPIEYHLEATSDGDKVTDKVPIITDPLEFDKTSLVWGKPRQPPLGTEEWAIFVNSEGRVVDSEALRKRIFYGGVEHELRKEVWPLLLGYHTYGSTYAEREYTKAIKKLEYEAVKLQWKSISPEQAKRFTKFRERKGLIDKDVVRTDRSLSFYEGDDNPNVDLLHDILLTYSFYNFDLGYCQGMSDFLSPILYVMRDESESFWCFVALLERLGPNFNRDQSGMHSQILALTKLVELLDTPLHNYFNQNDCLNYFFCFRWILIQFKREFEYEKTMCLWEALWTHYPSEHLHLYACVAVLKKYRNKIIGEQMDFDTLLKFINELSGQINLDATLREAEALCLCAGENGAASIPPGTPPSLPLEGDLLYSELEDEIL